jgi:hypothetical protein
MLDVLEDGECAGECWMCQRMVNVPEDAECVGGC